jgi:hypothetical protein
VALVGYMHDRTGLPDRAMTPTDVADYLSRHGCPAQLAEQCVALFRCCDEARFAWAGTVDHSLTSAAERLILDWEAEQWSPPVA